MTSQISRLAYEYEPEENEDRLTTGPDYPEEAEEAEARRTAEADAEAADSDGLDIRDMTEAEFALFYGLGGRGPAELLR